MMSSPKKCAVCGDKALGYNFNAVTCESCKAFFRRNALAKKNFTCPFSQNCEITVVTRRFCQKCRLKKCLDIGMKSENIMSEEDKLIKRRKIETNRAKRKQNEQKVKNEANGAEADQKQQTADSGFDAASCDSQSCGSLESSNGSAAAASNETAAAAAASSSTTTQSKRMLWDMNPELMTSEEMVEFIVGDPDRACQAINKLMRTPKEALGVLEKIINSQKDALRLISHLIAFPGDALKIISKLMNSPFNALTVFTKFMSSPTDALEIISKIVDSPQDVLQFIKNLMDSPENALSIMNKFMNTPAEALKIINRIFNGSTAQPATAPALTNETTIVESPQVAETVATPFHSPITPQSQMHSPAENTIIYSMLNGSPNGAQLMQTTQTQPMLSPYTPSPQSMSIAASSPDMQEFHSPASLQAHDELPSTSTGLIVSSPAHITPTAELTNDSFDIKSFMDSFADSNQLDSLNSLESVLTEVIRIEFQTFNSLPAEPRVKQEQHLMQLLSPKRQNDFVHCNSPQQSICSPSNVVMGRDLNEPEQLKLRELKLASEALYYPLDDDISALTVGDDAIKPEDTQQDPKLLQVINLTAVAIKRLIKMAKKISAFRDMCQEDQVALLKGGCTEMMIMRSVMTYDNHCHTWKIPHTKANMSNIRAEVLKLAPGNAYEEHLKFIRTFDEKWRLDENIILILCAIVLFTPTRPRVVHTDVIKLEQNSYYYLLRRYLESVYPGCEAKSVFIKLIQKISDVERLNQIIIGVYLNVNPAQVEPLLREIFDLKNH